MAKKRKKKEKEPLPGNFPRWLRDILIIAVSLSVGLGAGYYLTNWSEQLGEDSVADASEKALKEGAIPAVDPEVAEVQNVRKDWVLSENTIEELAITESDAQGTPKDPVQMDLPVEQTGGIGDPEDRVADGEAPDAVVNNCADFLMGDLDDNTRLKLKEGPVKAGFTVEFDGLLNPYSLITTTRMPDDSFDVVVIGDEESEDKREFQMAADEGKVTISEGTSLSWKAPSDPGIYCVRVLEKNTDRKMCFHVAVLKPWDGESEYLNGYHIGEYQDKPFRNNPRYKKPRGFIEVTEENNDTWISPHLQLSQFVCKQKADFPKYMLIDPRLLLKLEGVVDELEKSGRGCNHLYISSGFRTPAYNKALGNTTTYSRHLYGDAADMFVDNNEDGRIDDLDFDGSIDDGDAKLIQEKVQNVASAHRYLMGGLGFYSSASYRNPFIHLDTRGYSARWSK